MPKSLSSISLSPCELGKTMQQKPSQQASFAANCQQNKRTECITPAVCPGTLHPRQSFCWDTYEESLQDKVDFDASFDTTITKATVSKCYPTWTSDRGRANHASSNNIMSNTTPCKIFLFLFNFIAMTTWYFNILQYHQLIHSRLVYLSSYIWTFFLTEHWVMPCNMFVYS